MDVIPLKTIGARLEDWGNTKVPVPGVLPATSVAAETPDTFRKLVEVKPLEKLLTVNVVAVLGVTLMLLVS